MHLPVVDENDGSPIPSVPIPGVPVARGEGPRPTGFAQAAGRRFRLKFGKRGRGAFIAHLDTMRLLVRVFRRAGIEIIYSKGFHPKPVLVFGPALGLGVAALGEYCDVQLDWPAEAGCEELAARLRAVAPEGFLIEAVRPLGPQEPNLGKVIAQAEIAAWLPERPSALRPKDALASVTRTHTIESRKSPRAIDVSEYLVDAALADSAEYERIAARLGWPPETGPLEVSPLEVSPLEVSPAQPRRAILVARMRVDNDGGCKPKEIVEALTGVRPDEKVLYARLAVYCADGSEPLATQAAPPPRAVSNLVQTLSTVEIQPAL